MGWCLSDDCTATWTTNETRTSPSVGTHSWPPLLVVREVGNPRHVRQWPSKHCQLCSHIFWFAGDCDENGVMNAYFVPFEDVGRNAGDAAAVDFLPQGTVDLQCPRVRGRLEPILNWWLGRRSPLFCLYCLSEIPLLLGVLLIFQWSLKRGGSARLRRTFANFRHSFGSRVSHNNRFIIYISNSYSVQFLSLTLVAESTIMMIAPLLRIRSVLLRMIWVATQSSTTSHNSMLIFTCAALF